MPYTTNGTMGISGQTDLQEIALGLRYKLDEGGFCPQDAHKTQPTSEHANIKVVGY